MMRILWITNIPLPPICEEMQMPVPVVGGWMYSSAKRLIDQGCIKLAVATVYNGSILIDKEVDGIRYFLLPLGGKKNTVYQKSLEKYWIEVNRSFQPDITHLHGTEFSHGLACLQACPNIRSVVSIQGLVSVIDRYYLGNMTHWEVIRNITFRDIIRHNTLFGGNRSFTKRGKSECEIIRRVKHVIGRTTWDRVHAKAINPNVNYHFCNETLRDEFYKYLWSYEKCEKHSLFLSQASYPIKGLHIVLKALPFILHSYPDTHLYVAGPNITDMSSIKSKLKLSGYGLYIKRLVKKLDISKNVTFLGSLTEEQICQRFLASNLFICPSSIENSPNSLGEAQLLGVPCVASYVGGIPDMIEDKINGLLYQFEEYEILAEQVCSIFADDKISQRLSKGGREIAEKRHNALLNTLTLCNIYKTIIEDL